MKPLDFFALHPVFRLDEFAAARRVGNAARPEAGLDALKHHVKAGHLLRLRRGLYAVVPSGSTAKTLAVDPFLITSRITPDAVIAFHAALQFHGRAYSPSRRFTFFTSTRAKRFQFKGAEFIPVPVPPVLRGAAANTTGVVEHFRAGLGVRVTTLERTLVDVLHAPRHGGGWEEIWRSLESVEFFDLEAVIAYALQLGSAVTVARVGFFLDQHRQRLMVEERHLQRLAQHAPAHPMYLDRGNREPGKLQVPWNLIVPERVLNRTWEETA